MNSLRVHRMPSVWLKIWLPASLALTAVAGLAVYLELLGWRILTPDFVLSQAANQTFIFGALRTFAGATLLGVIFVLLGVIPRRARSVALDYSVLLWSIGASVFLIAMALLINWAP